MVAPAETSSEPSSRTRSLARESGDRLSGFADRELELPIPGSVDPVTLPAAAVRVLVDVLQKLADGEVVTVVPHRPDDYTVDRAAESLNVSRPYLLQQMDAGEIPFHGPADDRRIRPDDLAAYRQAMYDRRRNALRELTALDEELGLV